MSVFRTPRGLGGTGVASLGRKGDLGSVRVPKEERAEAPWNVGKYATFSMYETERCVNWVLVSRLNFQQNVDFFFQYKIPVKGINLHGRNNADFYVVPGGRGATYGVGAYPYTRGRVLNPISTFTHKRADRDIFEREIVRKKARVDVIYLLDERLYASPQTVVEGALRGVSQAPGR